MDLTRWYKRNDKFILASSFSLKKEMIFNEDNYDKEHWRIKLDRLQREDFNRIKIPKFNYEMVDNKILFEIEFIKGRQLGATTFKYWMEKIKDDIVYIDGDWGFSDLKPENFVVEKNTNQLYFVDFECYYPMSLEDRIYEWEKYLKIINLEIKNPHLRIDFENNAIKHSFWSS